MNYHKCAKVDCEAKTSKEFCRHHSVVYANCTYPNCYRRCRPTRNVCHNHTETEMQRKRDQIAATRLAKKNQAIAVK
jgi:hypothetical protein